MKIKLRRKERYLLPRRGGCITKAEDTVGNVMIYYQYDMMGKLIEEISLKGAKISYTYDKHDELTSITDAAGNITA